MDELAGDRGIVTIHPDLWPGLQRRDLSGPADKVTIAHHAVNAPRGEDGFDMTSDEGVGDNVNALEIADCLFHGERLT